MANVLCLILAFVSAVLAAIAFSGAKENLWRLQASAPHRKPKSGATVRGSIAEMAAKLALIVMELITILYLAIGKTPADALIFIGVDAPLSLNRYLFQFGSQIQVIIGTCAFIWLNRSIKECYFPRRGDGIELRSESMPTPPKTAEEKGELHA